MTDAVIHAVLQKSAGPRWLGGLKVERQENNIFFTALGKSGEEKDYVWVISSSDLATVIGLLGVGDISL